MKRIDRTVWVLWYLANLRDGEGVDILNSAFVDAYIDACEVPPSGWSAMAYGAHKCPAIGRDLSRMYGECQLTRSVLRLPAGSKNEGFPGWVYHYKILPGLAPIYKGSK